MPYSEDNSAQVRWHRPERTGLETLPVSRICSLTRISTMCLHPDPIVGRQISATAKKPLSAMFAVPGERLTPVTFESGRSSPPHASRKTAIRVTIRNRITIVSEIVNIPKEKRPRGERSVIGGGGGWGGAGRGMAGGKPAEPYRHELFLPPLARYSDPQVDEYRKRGTKL